MSDSDNLDDIAASINAIVEDIRLDRVGEEQALGRELASIVASGIADSGSVGEAPDGTEWPANEDQYAKYKAKRYGVGEHAPNVRSGQMLSLQSLLGDTTVSGDEVEMKYGLGEPPGRTSTGAPLSASDESISDIEKAYLNSPKRPFYMLSEAIADDCLEHAGGVVARWIEES